MKPLMMFAAHDLDYVGKVRKLATQCRKNSPMYWENIYAARRRLNRLKEDRIIFNSEYEKENGE